MSDLFSEDNFDSSRFSDGILIDQDIINNGGTSEALELIEEFHQTAREQGFHCFIEVQDGLVSDKKPGGIVVEKKDVAKSLSSLFEDRVIHSTNKESPRGSIMHAYSKTDTTVFALCEPASLIPSY